MEVIIELPGIKAVSRNETTGHFFKYKSRLNEAETWANIFGRAKEYHFEKQVDIHIEAYYNVKGRNKIADTPNIDDKIFTDILIRYKKQKVGPAIERRVWWIEDDAPTYLRRVSKESIRSDHYKVVITIKEVE